MKILRPCACSAPALRAASLPGLAVLLAVSGLYGQAGQKKAPPKPDVLISIGGERLLGRLEHADETKVTFRSDMLGEVTVDWNKIKELRSSQRFAVIEKDFKLGRHEDSARIPRGNVSMAEQTLTISPGPGQAERQIPVGNSAYLIDEPTFRTAVLHNPGLTEAWKGAITAGAALVAATQQSRTFNGTVGLIRTIPSETWLDTRNRTSVGFSVAYGTLTQPATPSVKTEIYHANFERDEYFMSRLYGFGRATYDHNFSQGLNLQQDYGGGIGWTARKTGRGELDFKGSVNYLRQQFEDAQQDQNLVGSSVAQSFNQAFSNGIVFLQQLSITPTWNNLDAYAAAGSASLSIPVYKRFSFTIGTVDSFLNNPPSGFRKNSFQFTTGLTYSLR